MSKYNNAMNTYLHNGWISSIDLFPKNLLYIFQAKNFNLDGLSKLL